MKVKVWVQTNKLGSSVEKIVEVDKEDYETLGAGSGRDEELNHTDLEEDMKDVLFDLITWNYEIVE